MPGTTPVSGQMSKSELASTLSFNEQATFENVTELTFDPTQVRNLVTTVAADPPFGELAIVASGAASAGQKILSGTVYVLGVKTAIDLYRLDVPDEDDF